MEKINIIFHKHYSIFLVIISSVVTFGMILTSKDNRFYDVNVFIVMCIFIAIFMLSQKMISIKNKRLKVCALGLAFLFAIFFIIGERLQLSYNLYGLVDSKISLFKTAIRLISVGYTSYCTIVCLLNRIELYTSNMKKREKNSLLFKSDRRKMLLTICFFAFIFAWLPYFLQYYPGLLSNDSIHQVAQTIGEKELTNHHPIMHTFMISIFINLGKQIGNYNIGVALYSLFQMILMSVTFTYTINYMLKKEVDKRIIFLTFLFYAFYPIHAIYSITMWKDIPFALAMSFFTIQIDKMCSAKEEFFNNKREEILLIISMILVMLFRNNGIYIIFIFIPILIITMKKYYKNVFLICLSVIAFFVFYKYGIFNWYHIKEVDIREALSLPAQQIARIEREHYNVLSDDEQREIEKYVYSVDNMRNNYSPVLSDPVKAELNSQSIANNMIGFLKLCLHLGIQFPKTTLEAFLCQNYGYWYPDFSYWRVANGISNNDGISERLNLKSTSLIHSRLISFMYRIAGSHSKIAILFSIGLAFWCVMIGVTYLIYQREYSKILKYIPILLLYLTVIASPVSGEFRYVYSMFVCMPLFFMNF